jgi:hypothetical protein
VGAPAQGPGGLSVYNLFLGIPEIGASRLQDLHRDPGQVFLRLGLNLCATFQDAVHTIDSEFSHRCRGKKIHAFDAIVALPDKLKTGLRDNPLEFRDRNLSDSGIGISFRPVGPELRARRSVSTILRQVA